MCVAALLLLVNGAIPVSLTTVPPSPVSERVTLDVRAGIWNTSEAQATYAVRFYLDEETPENLFHEQNLEVAAKSCAGVYARRPMAGSAGSRKLLAVVRCNEETSSASCSVEVVAGDEASLGVIGGAWLEFYHWDEGEGSPWNATVKHMTDENWRESIRGMRSLGMTTVVIEESFRNQMYVGKHKIEQEGYTGRAYYPSALYPGRMEIDSPDPIEVVLSEADRLGMNVFVPVGLYAWFDFTPASLEWHKKVADELYARYGNHRSFYAWYVSEEVGGDLGGSPERQAEIVDFFGGFRAHCRALAPEKPIMLASNCYDVKAAAATWPKLMQTLDIICPFGFHRMPEKEGPEAGEKAARFLGEVCDTAGAHLWMDLEAFCFGPKNALYPRPVADIQKDLKKFPEFEKVLCYQYTGLMNAPDATLKPGGDKTVELFNDYRRFLETRQNLGK